MYNVYIIVTYAQVTRYIIRIFLINTYVHGICYTLSNTQI